MNSGFEAVWLYIKALLPPGLNGALEPGGRENGIIPTNYHGLDFEIFDEPFGLVVEQASGDERNFRDDDFEDDLDSLADFIKEYQAKKEGAHHA